MSTAVLTKTKTDIVYSHSRLDMFQGCQRQFFYRYSQGRPYPANKPMIVGKIFHSAMEQLLADGYSPDEAVFWAIEQSGGLPEGERDRFLIRMVERAYYRMREYQDDEVDVMSELHLKVETPAGVIQGFLDLVIDDPMNDELVINDFKTSWQPYDVLKSRQLPLYAYLFKQARGGVTAGTFKGRLIFPRYDSSTDSEILFTDDILEEAYNWAAAQIHEIERRDPSNIEDWSMTKDRSKCEYCPYAALCAAGMVGGLPGDGLAKDSSEASVIGEYLLIQEAALKKMKEGLKAFVKKNGAVSIPGGRWEFVASVPNPKIDTEILMQFADEHEMSAAEALTVEPKVLKDWIEADESGFLKSHVSWTTPRNSFKFNEE